MRLVFVADVVPFDTAPLPAFFVNSIANSLVLLRWALFWAQNPAKSFRAYSCEESACKSFRAHSYKIIELKVSRNHILAKKPRGGGSHYSYTLAAFAGSLCHFGFHSMWNFDFAARFFDLTLKNASDTLTTDDWRCQAACGLPHNHLEPIEAPPREPFEESFYSPFRRMRIHVD